MTRIEGLEAVQRRLRKIQDPDLRKDALEAGAAYLERRMQKAPRKSPGAFSRLATPGQKRAFWAGVRSGRIPFREGVGYVRSGSARRWTSEVTPDRAIVGNNARHGPYVWGPPPSPMQQPFHAASGWPRTDKVANEEAGEVARVMNRIIDRGIQQA